MSTIASLSYFDLCDHAELLLPLSEGRVFTLIGQEFDPRTYAEQCERTAVISPLTTVEEQRSDGGEEPPSADGWQSDDKCFYTHYADQWRSAAGRVEELRSEPGTSMMRDALVLPLRECADVATGRNIYEGGVCTRDFHFLAGIQRNRRSREWTHSCCRAYACHEEAYVDERVVFGGVLFEAAVSKF